MKFQLADREILRRKSLCIWLAALIALLLDYYTKALALRQLKSPGEPLELTGGRVIEIIPGLLNLRYAFNTGGAFSLMDDHFVLLTLLAGIALAILLYWVYSTPMKYPAMWIAFGMIIGGAIGNLGDRLLRGGVIDFIDAHWRDYHWPTFNLADSAICVGMGVIVYLTMFFPEKHEAGRERMPSTAQPQSNR